MAPLLEVDDLQVSFVTEEGTVNAVSGVSFTVGEARSWPSSASPARASR